MAEESQADNPRGVGHGLGGLDISVTRLGVSARVVVRERERATVAAQHGVEDLADRDAGAVHSSLRNDDAPERTVGRVAGDDEHMLAPEASELALGDRRDVGRPTDDGRRVR